MNSSDFTKTLRYQVPLPKTIFLTLIVIWVIKDSTENLQNLTDYIFATWMGLGLIPVIHLWSHNLFLKQYVALSDEGIEFKTNILTPWKKEFLRYQEINFIRCITSSGRSLHIQGEGVKIELNLWWMNVDDWIQLVETLEKRLPHLSPLPTEELHRIYREEKDFSSFWMWSVICISFLSIYISRQIGNHENYQIESQGYTLPIFIGCAFISFLIRRRFYSNYRLQIRPNQKKANLYALGFGLSTFFVLNGIGAFSNQKLDDSRAQLRILSLVKSQESREYEKEHGPCYTLIDDNLKKAYVEFQLCHPEFSKAKESSKVVVGYKKGFLGQRWVASVKVVD